MKRFAVILAGCGVYDGAEIHEAVLSMLAIKKAGASYTLFAPDIEQHHVVNHLSGEEMSEKRNVLIESARIARGNISKLSDFSASDFDILLLPGGFGVAKNLCNFAFEGINCRILPEVEKVIKDMLDQKKPIGALCISPVLLAKIIGNNVKLTIGQDEGTAKAIDNFGAEHRASGHGEVVVDEIHKVVTTPCYMLDAGIDQIAEGAENIVKALLKL